MICNHDRELKFNMLRLLTMCSRIDATNGRNGRSTRHDKLVILALVVRRLRLRQHKVVEIQSTGTSKTIQFQFRQEGKPTQQQRERQKVK